MKLEEYWNTEQTEQSTNDTQIESFNLESQQFVCKAKANVAKAKHERDAYIIALKDSTDPRFANVVEHEANILLLEEAYNLAQDVHNKLFN